MNSEWVFCNQKLLVCLKPVLKANVVTTPEASPRRHHNISLVPHHLALGMQLPHTMAYLSYLSYLHVLGEPLKYTRARGT